MKEILKRMCISFAISSFAGLLVNLLIDFFVNAAGAVEGFVSIPPEFLAKFTTPVMAAYANVLLYGVIGASFATMTFVFEINRLGFLLQYLLYFCLTGIILAFVTLHLWELHRYPVPLICTLSGYAMSFLIMGIVQYRMVKQDIDKINELIVRE
ncbi:MAG: DUF3021 domain-containing protein [Lachnospiraceae bacterium]|nr:DUF3021 domain-containing protein [Lachnospiraceae bacterium]